MRGGGGGGGVVGNFKINSILVGTKKLRSSPLLQNLHAQLQKLMLEYCFEPDLYMCPVYFTFYKFIPSFENNVDLDQLASNEAS